MFITRFKFPLFLLSLFILSSCSSIPVKQSNVKKPAISASSKQNNWKKRQLVVAKKSNWALNSKVALRYREDHWSFGLTWLQQSANQYVMQIKNPVTGGLLAKLTRKNNRVSLLSDNGRVYNDSDEERLLQRQAGVKLPVKGMQYWMRGLSSPRYKVDKLVLDSRGRPLMLHQAGWKISYAAYVNNQYDAMPRKVVITRDKDNVYLKMIAKKWQGL